MQTRVPATVAPAKEEGAGNGLQRAAIADKRSGTAQALQLRQMIEGSGHAMKGRTLQALLSASAQAGQVKALQRMANPGTAAPNNTGLPDQLKSGIESLSGMSMDHVKVNYNSAKPAQLNAHAFAQGSEIHVAPGQERHLPHEAWHVVQQAQGRVKPTMQMKTGVPVNDDAALESEADSMGAKAVGAGTVQRKGRVDWDAVKDHEHADAIKQEVEAARIARITAKDSARMNWLPKNPDKKHVYTEDDKTYNTAMELARKQYGLELLKIKEKFSLNDKQFVTGKQYYGVESNGVWKRPGGKEYVEDSNGVFVSKYVRRELNKVDLPILDPDHPQSLGPTGSGIHTAAVKGKNGNKEYGDVTRQGEALNFGEREFLQQSLGGGGNQFAFSHTATKHPILSNDHNNFGKPGKKDKPEDPHGRIVTDLSKIPVGERRAQWTLAPEEEGGHKIKRADTDFDAPWMHARREKVIASGYRNMEVITANVPANSVDAKHKQSGWEEDHPESKSRAGQWFEDIRNPKKEDDAS
jgi:hypothetical protein